MLNERWIVRPGDIVVTKPAAPKVRLLGRTRVKYSPDQPRDEIGRFGETGGGGSAEPTTTHATDTEAGIAGRAAIDAALMGHVTQPGIPEPLGHPQPGLFQGQSWENANKTDQMARALKIDNVRELGMRIYMAASENPELRAALESKQPWERIAEHAQVTGTQYAEDPVKWDTWNAMQSPENWWSQGVNAGQNADKGELKMPEDRIEAAAMYWAAGLQSSWAASSGDGDVKSIMVQDAATRVLGAASDSGLLASFQAEVDSRSERLDAFGTQVNIRQLGGEGLTNNTYRGDGSDAAHAAVTWADSVAAYREQYQPIADTFVRETYDRTQEFLAEKGVTEVTLDRGMHFSPTGDVYHPWSGAQESIPPTPEWLSRAIDPGETVHMQSNPISSWSTSESTALRFANSQISQEDAFVVHATVPAAQVFSFPAAGPGCLLESEVLVLGHPGDEAALTSLGRALDA